MLFFCCLDMYKRYRRAEIRAYNAYTFQTFLRRKLRSAQMVRITAQNTMSRKEKDRRPVLYPQHGIP